MSHEFVLVYVTAPDAATAASIGRAAVQERLAACANIHAGVRSIYHWDGALCDEAEVLLLLKTSAAEAQTLTRRVRELHPWTCPAILQLPIVGGDGDYLAWMRDQLL
jgi:periplasmic divalent cation tolerance protein